jgi:hypothetical protein
MPWTSNDLYLSFIFTFSLSFLLYMAFISSGLGDLGKKGLHYLSLLRQDWK